MKSCFMIGLLVLASLVTGCQKSESSGTKFKTEVPLKEFSEEKCPNLEKYISAFNQLFPDPSIRQTTTNVSIAGNGQVSHGFAIRVAYGNFVFANKARESIFKFQSVKQTDCTTVTMTSPGGRQETYQVTSKSEDELQFKNEAEESYSFKWLSPKHFKTVHKFESGDFLCRADSKLMISVETDYSWEPDFLTATTLPVDFISADYLVLVAEATGHAVSNLYATDAAFADTNRLVVSELQKLDAEEIKPGFEACSSVF